MQKVLVMTSEVGKDYQIVGPPSLNHQRRMNLTGRRYLPRKTDLK